ncbi:hypothetical protein [Novosphingobium album (ex Hu et al. 2023)]|uniref:Uncharacterized protein n=1 Tax=Novosphingobium album (ex Hu et al. 2023) TaxID=2930093 RepID=A0ABT0AWD8_9SPHN|nr:hypothetical protein [Novosphingobium album (ex Hu et al. 2023)]MCJ2176970.1 hypothetical protein [Novosphingobium album (ex Hu et al. 2023)]
MISAFLLAIAGLSATPASAYPAYGTDTVRSLKGHPSLPVAAKAEKSAATQAKCHPEPSKGRTCRHHVAQTKQERQNAPALAEASNVTSGESMQ